MNMSNPTPLDLLNATINSDNDLFYPSREDGKFITPNVTLHSNTWWNRKSVYEKDDVDVSYDSYDSFF